MSLQATLAVGVGAAGYLKYVGKVPASLADAAKEAGDVKAASYAVVASGAVLAANLAEYLVYGPNGAGPISRVTDFVRTCLGQESARKIVVNDWIDEYNKLHKAEDASVRNSAYASLVNHYYELATLFYEVGWCQSFHFAYHMVGESFAEGIRRHEYYLASFLGGLKPASKVPLFSLSHQLQIAVPRNRNTCILGLHGLPPPFSFVGVGGCFRQHRFPLGIHGQFSSTPVFALASTHPANSFISDLCTPPQIIDVGCGIGGPYRNIARFTGWDITGVNAQSLPRPPSRELR